MKRLLLLFAAVFTVFNLSQAQDFLVGADRFSSKVLSYITDKDGKEYSGYIDDIDRKKGLIEEITIKVGGKKKKFKPEQIDFMYLQPSGFDKLGKTMSKSLNLSEEKKDRTINMEKVNEGYVLFETTEVMLKKKKRTLLMQLLNPGFANKMRVYHDPFAKESASVGIGGFTVAGGEEKSYFVKSGDKPAEKLKSKDYEDAYKMYYKECSDLYRKFEDKDGWKKFAEHLYYYSTECGG